MAIETVTIATDIDAVEALRADWKAFDMADIDADIDYFLTVTRLAGNVVRPHVVHMKRHGRGDLLAVARIEHVTLPFKLGYRRLGSVRLRAVLVAFGGLLGARNRADEELLLRYLMQPLERGEADLLVLRNLDIAGTLHAAASASCGWLRRSHANEVSGRWMVRLPGSLDELLAARTAKTRSTLRRHERRLRSEYGDRLRLRRFEHVKDLHDLRLALEHVSARAYQRGLGAGYSDSPLDNALLELALRQGRHSTWMLYLDERPVAFWTGTTCGATFAIGTPGFDPDFARDSFGRFTMLRMLEDLCADPSIDLLDFGHGEAEYKSAFGECMRTETGLVLTSRAIVPIAANQLSSALSLINNQGRRIVRDAEWGKRLKRKWRARTGFGEKAGAAT